MVFSMNSWWHTYQTCHGNSICMVARLRLWSYFSLSQCFASGSLMSISGLGNISQLGLLFWGKENSQYKTSKLDNGELLYFSSTGFVFLTDNFHLTFITPFNKMLFIKIAVVTRTWRIFHFWHWFVDLGFPFTSQKQTSHASKSYFLHEYSRYGTIAPKTTRKKLDDSSYKGSQIRHDLVKFEGISWFGSSATPHTHPVIW